MPFTIVYMISPNGCFLEIWTNFKMSYFCNNSIKESHVSFNNNKHQNVKLFLQFTKMASKEASLRNRVYKFYEQNIDRGKSFTYRHFAAENVSKSTLYSILQRFERGVGAGRKKELVVKLSNSNSRKSKKCLKTVIRVLFD
jgi:hypothetical protein